MKKILYTLFAVSLLAVACTQEVGVSRDHDIDAEVTDMQTKMEITTLYLNLTEAGDVNLDKLALYLSMKSADVAMFVAPKTVGTTLQRDFMDWFNRYANENNLKSLVAINDDNRLVMAALVKSGVTINEVYTLQQGATLNNAVLHFKANDIHFVVTELLAAKNAIPDDWEAQVEAMTKNKKSVPLVYTPDVLAARKSELSYIIKQTVDNKAFLKDVNWYFAINTNADSHLDIVKYEKEFYRENCYDAPADNPDFYWEDFLATETTYFSVEELLAADDIYFTVSNLMMYYNLVECNAVHHSVYTASSTDGSRANNVYATDECWNMFRTFDFDASLTAEAGLAHHPIIVTLKSEE
ncbi:MAG: hypothetical protein IKB90_04705 [Alistipes sp.]|nr:hypothetical protein [Alistipes sp.]